MIEELVIVMKQMIVDAGAMRGVDNIARICCSLLDKMGYDQESDDVYEFYQLQFE